MTTIAELVAEARGLLAKATSEPWTVDVQGFVVRIDAFGLTLEDATAIAAAAPTLIANLCDELERLERINKLQAKVIEARRAMQDSESSGGQVLCALDDAIDEAERALAALLKQEAKA